MKKLLLISFILSFQLVVMATAQGLNKKKKDPDLTSSYVTGDIYSQIQVRDLDNDGKKEMIFSASDGAVHVYDYKGKEKKIGAFPFQTSGPILSKPVITYNKKNKLTVYVGSMDGNLYSIDAQNGMNWKFNTGGHISYTNPEIVKDNKGNRDIFIASKSGKVFKLDENGKTKWVTDLKTSIVTPIQVGKNEKNGDDSEYMVVRGTNGVINYYDLKGKKSSEPVWHEKVTKGDGSWPVPFHYLDLNLDGKKEIYTSTNPGLNPKKLKISKIENGKKEDIRCAMGRPSCRFTFSDLDNDGYKDIVAVENRYDCSCHKNFTYLVAYDRNGKMFKKFPRKLGEDTYSNVAPKVVDITGDGKKNIVFTYWQMKKDGTIKGYLDAIDTKGNRVTGYPKDVGISEAEMTIADLDGDGKLELIVPGGVSQTGAQLNIIKTKGKLPVKVEVIGKVFKIEHMVKKR